MSKIAKAALASLMLAAVASADDSNVVIRLDTSNLVFFNNWTVANTYTPLSQVLNMDYSYQASVYNSANTTTTMTWTPNSVEAMIVKLCNYTDPQHCDSTSNVIGNTYICDSDNTTMNIPSCGSGASLTIPDFRNPGFYSFQPGLNYLKLSIKAFDSDKNDTHYTGLYTSYLLTIDNLSAADVPATAPPTPATVATLPANATAISNVTLATSAPTTTTPTSTATPSTAVPSTAAPATTATPTTSVSVVTDNTKTPTTSIPTTATGTTVKPATTSAPTTTSKPTATSAIKTGAASSMAPILAATTLAAFIAAVLPNLSQ